MKLKLNLKLKYQYKIALSLATNGKVKIKEIEMYISKAVDDYNVYSRTAKNVKEISTWSINAEEDLLLVCLNSFNPLPTPSKGLRLLSQLIIKNMKETEKGTLLVEDIIKKNSFFKCVGTVEQLQEVEDLKLQKSEEVHETNINLSEVSRLLQEITALFLNPNPSEQEREKIKAIKRVLKEGE